jgi:hypothetical protein
MRSRFSPLLCVFVLLAVASASVVVRTIGAQSIATWNELHAALDNTGINGTFTLTGPAFLMGDGAPQIDISGGTVIILGNGAVVGNGTRLFAVNQGASLDLQDLTMQHSFGVSLHCR